jgi:hypothetical protein
MYRPGRLVALLGLLSLASCTNVVESYRVPVDDAAMAFDDAGPGSPCMSKLGSYSLPKSFLRVRVGRKKDAPPDIALFPDGSVVQVIPHADPSLLFCLDHLSAPNAQEQVKIIKWAPPDQPTAKTGFLGAVLVNVTDQTAYIMRALIRAAFIAISGAPSFPRTATFGDSEIIADLEFDPFDQREAATVNSQLTKLGVCVVLPGYMYDPRFSPEQYCSDPDRHAVVLGPIYKAYRTFEETPADPHLPGLLYRARYPYRVGIYQKKDPQGPGKWRLSQMTTVLLENLSPVLSLGITRTVFANKTMNFVFNAGTLHTACVAKDSEALGFVQVPLEVAKSIVALPASIISVKIGAASQQQSLVAAQQQLWQMQQSYMKVLAGGPPSAVGGAIPTVNVPTGSDPANFSIPGDLVPATPNKDPFGADLFKNTLSTVCNGGVS